MNARSMSSPMVTGIWLTPSMYACRSDFWYGTFDADRLGMIESMYPLYRCSHWLNVRPQYLCSQIIGMLTVIVLLNGVDCVITVHYGGGGSLCFSLLNVSPRARRSLQALGGGSLRSDMHSLYLTW